MQLMVQPRPCALRCALCHASAEEVLPCLGCGTRVHDACAREVSRSCPTLGCGVERAPLIPVIPRSQRWLDRLEAACYLAVWPLVFLGPAYGYYDWVVNGPLSVPAGW